MLKSYIPNLFKSYSLPASTCVVFCFMSWELSALYISHKTQMEMHLDESQQTKVLAEENQKNIRNVGRQLNTLANFHEIGF